jgi:hypothetical protein
MSHAVDWSPVTPGHVKNAIKEYDRLGADAFFKQHGYAPTTTYDLITSEGTYPPKARIRPRRQRFGLRAARGYLRRGR